MCIFLEVKLLDCTVFCHGNVVYPFIYFLQHAHVHKFVAVVVVFVLFTSYFCCMDFPSHLFGREDETEEIVPLHK